MKKKSFKKFILFIALIVGLVVLPITFARYEQVINKKIIINVRKPNYIVYFNSNRNDGNADDVSSQSFVYGTSQNLQANAFTNGSMVFQGWNTARDGSGTAYTDGQEVTNLSSTDGDEIYLYAQWAGADVWLTYDYGTTQFLGNKYLKTGIGLFSNANINRDFEISMGVSNFHVLDGQDSNRNVMLSNQNETGTPYPGFTFHLRNGKIQTQVNCVRVQEVERAWNKTSGTIVFSRTNNKLYQDGTLLYDFANQVTPFESSVSLGANLDENGNPRRFSIVDLSNVRIKMKYTSTEFSTLYQNLPVPAQTNKVFVGWFTALNGGTQITSQAELEQAGGTIYPHWSHASTVTVTFDANDGSNRTSTQTVSYGSPTALNANTYTRAGYTFMGWNLTSNGSGPAYADGTNITTDTNITLYAQWLLEPATSYTASSLTFNGQNSDIIDTGVYLFNAANIHKNFEISFDINSVASSNITQPTLLNTKDESGAPYPGFVLRKENNYFILKGDSTASNTNSYKIAYGSLQKIKLVRISDVVYYSINDGAFAQLMDYSNIVRTFDAPLALGGLIRPDGSRDRAFKGTISNVVVRFISDNATLSDFQSTSPSPAPSAAPSPSIPDDSSSGGSETNGTVENNETDSTSNTDSGSTNENNNTNETNNEINTETNNETNNESNNETNNETNTGDNGNGTEGGNPNEPETNG